MVERLGHVLQDPYEWKWVIIGLDNALQNWMVEALRGSAAYHVIHPRIRDRWWAALQTEARPPDERLDEFFGLYESIQSDAMDKFVQSKRLEPTPMQEDAVGRLHQLRNEFVHFVPKLWSLEVSGLPAIIYECTCVIRFLAFQSGNIWWHKEDHASRTTAALSNIDAAVSMLRTAYDC